MNIIELAREAGFDWHSGWTLDDDEPNRFVTFAAAVIKAHEAKLIEGVGEPAGSVEVYAGTNKNGFSEFIFVDAYSAEQVAGAVAIGKYAINTDRYARERRIATLESALKMALEALEEATTYTSSPSWSPSMTEECRKAADKIKEVLHD